jgi:hypothetical protein
MNEREVMEAKQRRSEGRAFRRGQEDQERNEAQKRVADATVERVVEVNEFGQLKLAQTLDRATNARGVVEMVGGYRQPSGAISAYDPVARGLGNGDE